MSTNDFTDGYKNKVDRLVEGTRGYSNYELAVQNGFEGTEQEYLNSLKGDTGPQGPAGTGDMQKSVYDPDNDGIIDNAKKANGHTVQKDVPENAEFTDTTYTNATITQDGLMSKEDKAKLDNYVGGVTGDTLPIGSIQEWPSNIIPNNWLLCNGQAVSRTDYAELFVVLGTTYGAGDGSTTFNLPNFKGRVGVGKDDNDSDFNALGKTAGEKTHVLTTTEMPQHCHGENFITKYGYQYSLVSNNGEGEEKNGYLPELEGTEVNKNQVLTNEAGGSQAHNNLQPHIVTNYIIKAHQSAGIVAEVIQKDGEATAENVYSAEAINKIIENLNNTAYCQMSVTGGGTNYTNATIVTHFGLPLSHGGFIADVQNSRLEIPKRYRSN